MIPIHTNSHTPSMCCTHATPTSSPKSRISLLFLSFLTPYNGARACCHYTSGATSLKMSAMWRRVKVRSKALRGSDGGAVEGRANETCMADSVRSYTAICKLPATTERCVNKRSAMTVQTPCRSNMTTLLTSTMYCRFTSLSCWQDVVHNHILIDRTVELCQLLTQHLQIMHDAFVQRRQKCSMDKLACHLVVSGAEPVHAIVNGVLDHWVPSFIHRQLVGVVVEVGHIAGVFASCRPTCIT